LEKIILAALATLLLTSSAVFAQEVTFGDPAEQAVKITISENGDAHVTHVIEDSKKPQQVQVVRDNFTNLQILDENGGAPQYGEAGGEKTNFVIFPNDDKVLIDYDLPNAVTQEGGMWTWNYLYLASTSFYLPEKIDLLFVNSSPVYLGDHKGIRCHGCQMTLEYELEKTETTKQVQWEDRKFDVRVITQADITSFEFDQPNKKLSLDVGQPNKYVTLIIPLELLWKPYEVFLDGEKILKHEFYTDGKDAWLNFKPNSAGKIEIIGVSAVPEFPVAALLVLGAAMAVVAKFGKLSLR
jgi:hypothetical protein